MNSPLGVLKFNADGIHGAEVAFLGKSLPVHTTLIPAAVGSVTGALGARAGGPRRGILAGTLGTGIAMGMGQLLEGERKRRNQAKNEREMLDTIDRY